MDTVHHPDPAADLGRHDTIGEQYENKEDLCGQLHLPRMRERVCLHLERVVGL